MKKIDRFFQWNIDNKIMHASIDRMHFTKHSKYVIFKVVRPFKIANGTEVRNWFIGLYPAFKTDTIDWLTEYYHDFE